MRSGGMFGLAVSISLGLLTLLVLREAAGATFFLQYETEHLTQVCNASSGGGNTAWWAGQQGSSLQTFERQCCDADGMLQARFGKCTFDKCPNELPPHNFHRGGIFACKTLTGRPIPENGNPVFTSKENCTDFNFFIVAAIKSPAGQRSENLHGKVEEKVSIEENHNFTLSCEFELGRHTTIFAVYWLKGTSPSKCLFSASNEADYSIRNVTYDINCCIDDAFRDRRIHNSTTSGDPHRNQMHGVTITKSTMADKGSYFCLLAAYNGGQYTWTIERRISVNVVEGPPPSSITELQILLAAIAGALLLMGGIILFLCCRKRAKGKPLESQPRDQTTVATDDCSPYAVSSRDDLNGQETVYSLATSPGETPSAVCFSPQSEPAPGVQHENVQALYSKVLKNKSSPSSASDSSI